MNSHLKSVVLRDKRRKKQLITPISELDAEIIWELIIILGKLEIYDIKSIVEHWKYLKDESIRDLLLEWNTDHPEGVESDDEKIAKKSRRKFIEFENSMIEVAPIKSLDRDDNYNYATNEMDYRIIINKNLPENFIFSDLIFSFPSNDLREVKLKELKKHLSKFINIV